MTVRPTDVTENRLDRLEMLVADIASRIDGLTARNAKKGSPTPGCIGHLQQSRGADLHPLGSASSSSTSS